MMKQITTINDLESCVGKTPGPRDLKVIDYLDANAIDWISESPCAFISLAAKANKKARVLISGGPVGFVQTETARLHFPKEYIDEAELIAPGDGWGTLFVIPSQRESLRVNGRVDSVSASSVTVAVTECYLHCAKAFMRSKLWEDYEIDASSAQSEDEFAARTRFMLVATSDHALNADLSPKGDPAGQLLHLENGSAWYPDRPGNRRVDGFRNIITNPEIEIVALIAGSSHLLRLRGQAAMYSEHPMKSRFMVDNKALHLVAKIVVTEMMLEDSPALKRANLWPPSSPNKTFKPTDIWKDHMKLSKVNGIEATLAKAAISLPGVIETGIDWDYKNNMY